MKCNYGINGGKLMKHRYCQKEGNKAIHSNKAQSHESGTFGHERVSALSPSGYPGQGLRFPFVE